ncbi:MAG: lipoprotein signal peptidase [Betaproteobacteria bacterium]|nr:lipoprotein signal peptidase [Betaproteobacteria bacterium]
MKRWLGIAAVIIVLDQATKFAVSEWLAGGRVVEVTSFFNFVLAHNAGAAFSFLAGAAGWQRLFFSTIAVIAAVWIVVLLRRHAHETLFCLALSLILGGALGNLIDRIWLGAVVDFLDFHAMGWHWPAFNVADSAISCGAVLIVIDSLRAQGKS